MVDKAGRTALAVIAATTMLIPATGAIGQDNRPSLKDSFRIGSGGGVLCQAQAGSAHPVLKGIFDRSWSLVCRDALRPVGQLFQLRDTADGTAQRLASVRRDAGRCASAGSVPLEGIGDAARFDCAAGSDGAAYRVYIFARGRVSYAAEGLAGYDSALLLALRTIIADRFVPGAISVVTTGASDTVGFARVQAATLDPDQALAEGYRRNNSGDYAEAAEFFDTLEERVQRGEGRPIERNRRGEYLINQALQKSNLGAFAEADALFAEADREPFQDRVQSRLKRNFKAIHALNQSDLAAALAILNAPVVSLDRAAIETGDTVTIPPALAAEINGVSAIATRLGVTRSTSLTADERATLLDAQALQLRGTVLRLQGKPGDARRVLETALIDAVRVRDGRVTSIYRLRAQTMAEIALTLEAEGDIAGAEMQLRDALDLLAVNYPESAAMNGARARLAAFLARHGKRDAAIALYRQVVASVTANRDALVGVANQLEPYFDLLASGIADNAALTDDLFLASQTIIRPGAADTQAILTRQLSQGDSVAARMFRQSVTLNRDIERLRIELARLQQIADPGPDIRTQTENAVRDLDTLGRQQAATLAALAAYPQYRAVSRQAVTLAEMRALLKPGEAYFKLAATRGALFAIYADQNGATGYRVPITPDALDAAVTRLRASIAVVENGQLLTYPFDVETARTLFVDLFGPVADRLTGIGHLIVEPDGALLKLPVNLLIASQSGVDRYLARASAADSDIFDFTGIDWLGRGRAISTALSARGFVDARQLPRSSAPRPYLGLGENTPPSFAARTTPNACDWPLNDWRRPISARELSSAAASFGPNQAVLRTGAAFSDRAIIDDPALDQFRIVHFATHGLVTAPRPECPARPALLTSFAANDSDGLLSFGEIYGLKLDADLVILSACDTAGTASIAATREAGVTRGGGSALDGLVRAFIGAGGRAVIASHWPAPDDFNATEELISGMFRAEATTTIGAALSAAQLPLMDTAATSHPYYWSAFAIVGDGGQPMPDRAPVP